MRVLGIDFGLAKVGISISSLGFAEPLEVIRYKNETSLEIRIEVLVQEYDIEKVVVGISEGEMAKKIKVFIDKLSASLTVPVETYDETLSTHEANERSRASGISRKKRREMEDAYAATVMLQNYLDSN